MMRPEPEPSEPTQDLRRAFAVAARVSALPPHLHPAAIQTACGDDQELQRQVKAVLHSPVSAEKARALGDLVDVETFGRYALHERIGEGSMGIVYRATQCDTRRVVALKRLRPGEASDAMLQRFRREVVLLARLRHRGIVQILDAGHVATPNGREPYLAMELVEGPPLLVGAEQWRLDHRARVKLLVQVCRAIGHAHRHGVIHRDIKPDNVRLEVEQHNLTPRVLDFGVATASATNSSEATQAQHVVGTLGHIAPEQIDGEVDVRCDVYSLGVLGYKLLTGRCPIDVRGLGVLSAIARIRDAEPVPAGQLDPRLRGDLEAVLAKSIARHADDRYASADEFGNDLERWLHNRPVDARRSTPWYLLSRFVRRQRKLSAAVASLLLVLGLSGYSTFTSFADATSANTSLITVLTSAVGQLSARINGSSPAAALPEELRTAVAAMIERFPDDLGVRKVQAEFLQVDSQIARSGGQAQRALELRKALLEVRHAISLRSPSSEATRNLALAHVLLGDIQKEIAQQQHLPLAHAQASYEAALPLYIERYEADRQARQPRDDLAHNFLRLAALDLYGEQLEIAEERILKAQELAESLARQFSDNPNTFSLLRELSGMSSSLAEHRGNHPFAMALMDKMLESIEVVHSLDPDNLHFAEYLLSTIHACASSALQASDVEKARRLLARTDPLVQQLAARAPDNLQATEQRMLIAMLWARMALHDDDLVGALRHLTTATDLVLRQSVADDLTAMHANCRDIASVVCGAICRLGQSAPPSHEGEQAACRLLFHSFTGVTNQFPEDHTLRITHSLIQVSYCSREELAAVRSSLATAQREGWRDPWCWFIELQVLERSGEIAAAKAKLETAPDNLSPDLLAAVAHRRDRWNGK